MESNSAPSAHYVQKSKLSAKYCFDDIIHSSAVMVETLNRCQKIARNDSSVMIFGETGTGKELFAQSIHNASRRANTPFLAINCAAIPANLLEGLFYRLGVVQITVPPLRERTDDIALLVNHFIAHYNQVMSRNVHRLDAEVLNIFRRYNRPGNVRELQHAIEYVMNILPDEYNVITADYLPDHIRTFEAARAPAAAPQPSPLFQQAAPVGYQ